MDALHIEVTETVVYRHSFELTEELLTEAAAEGYGRTMSGVVQMLEVDTDHEIVANSATTPANLSYVSERTVQEV